VTSREVIVCADAAGVSHAAADAIVEAARDAVTARGRFSLALAGGATPRALYGLLATEYVTRLPWHTTEIFFGDERCVPPDDPESNFRMAHESLITRIPGLATRTHRICGELPPDQAATQYDTLLRNAFVGRSPATFDVLLLGIGTDGHTASLFPGNPALAERDRWAVASEAPPGVAPHDRVTLTYPALDAALNTIFMCAGPDKRPILDRIRAAGLAAGDLYPAARVTARQRLRWLVDRAAWSDGA
jgi:6-phosphogluconolactonase